MKSKIVGVLIYPHYNEYVVTVTRWVCDTNKEITRTYSKKYSDESGVWKLWERAIWMISKLQADFVAKRIIKHAKS